MGTGNPTGRPRKKISKVQFEELCKIQCTEDEICAVLDVTDKTLTKWVAENYEGRSFSDVYRQKRDAGKKSLRRSQWKLAETNATLSIWLGKQYLGQRDDIVQSMDARNDILESLFRLEKDAVQRETEGTNNGPV